MRYVVVVNRYGKNTIGKAIVRNYGIKTGGIGRVEHDCHNIVMIYDTPENAIAMLQDLGRTVGGYVCVKEGEILDRIVLPLAGLMSNMPIDIVAQQSKFFKNSLEKLGVAGVEFPLFIMAVLPLPVVPSARLTDLGMVNALTQEFVNLFV